MQLQDIEKQLKDSGALPYLLSGGVGALAGGALASGVSRRGESKLGRLGRILGTGLASGAATAGAHKLLDYGTHQFTNALPVKDVSPEQELVSGTGTRASAAALAAAAITGRSHLNDTRTWEELARANPELWGSAPNNNGKTINSYGNFARHRDNYVADAGKRTGQNNAYKGLLDENVDKPLQRSAIDNKLKSLGINSTDGGFKLLDGARSRHMAGTGGKLGEFLVRNEGKMMSARNRVIPTLSKLTGRSRVGALGRAALIGGAAMYPEIIGTATEPFKPSAQ